jgi:hypothetical protein
VHLQPKASLYLTSYAQQRPNLLGGNVPEQLREDYNSQPYWVAAEVGAILWAGNLRPRWLQPAVGYAGKDMVYYDDGTNAQVGLRPCRQSFLVLNMDLRCIASRSVLLKKVFNTLSIFHLPAPALEISGRNRLRWHGLHIWGLDFLSIKVAI